MGEAEAGLGFRVLGFKVGSGERVGGAWGRQNSRGYEASLGSHGGIQGIMQGHIGSSFVHELYIHIDSYLDHIGPCIRSPPHPVIVVQKEYIIGP